MRVFPVICGPTAGAKSALALALARALPGGGEVVSADAFQVYRGMDIGTAKPLPDELRAVPHHLVNIRDPREPFTVDDWLALAEDAIRAIRSRGRTPIVVGGTHLYIKALLDGLFEGPPPDPALRAELHALDATVRRTELERADPVAAARIHPADVRRTVRALEVHRLTGKPISSLQQQWDRSSRPDALLVVLHWPTDALNRRINARVKDMFASGLVDEVRSLVEGGLLGEQAREGVGYKQLIPVIEGRMSPEDGLEQVKIATRRLGKSQRTWLRRLAGGAITPETQAQSPDVPVDSRDMSARSAGAGRPLILRPDRETLESMAQVVVQAVLARSRSAADSARPV